MRPRRSAQFRHTPASVSYTHLFGGVGTYQPRTLARPLGQSQAHSQTSPQTSPQASRDYAAFDDCQLPPEQENTAPGLNFARPRGLVPHQEDPAVSESHATGNSGMAATGNAAAPQGELCYCRHRIFGRGKIIKHLSPEKVQVNFPGFGLKVILSEYLLMEN